MQTTFLILISSLCTQTRTHTPSYLHTLQIPRAHKQVAAKGVAEDKGHVATPLAAVKAIVDTLGEPRLNQAKTVVFEPVPACSQPTFCSMIF